MNWRKGSDSFMGRNIKIWAVVAMIVMLVVLWGVMEIQKMSDLTATETTAQVDVGKIDMSSIGGTLRVYEPSEGSIYESTEDQLGSLDLSKCNLNGTSAGASYVAKIYKMISDGNFEGLYQMLNLSRIHEDGFSNVSAETLSKWKDAYTEGKIFLFTGQYEVSDALLVTFVSIAKKSGTYNGKLYDYENEQQFMYTFFEDDAGITFVPYSILDNPQTQFVIGTGD
jgi:hypothetical protein